MITQIALVADVHGNLPALEAVLADIERRGVQRIFFLGDAVGKGPQSAEVFDLIRNKCERVVRGNWEDAVLDGWVPTASYYRSKLGQERLETMRRLPLGIFMRLSGRTVKLFHGRTTIDKVVFSSAKKEDILEVIHAMGDGSDVVGFADVHQPFLRMCEQHMLFNIGSVGNPCDGIPQCSYGILRGDEDSAELTPLSLELVRLPYDRKRSIQLALDTPDLPGLDLYIREVNTGHYQR